MRDLLFISIILFLTIGCKNKTTSTDALTINTVEQSDISISNEYKSDNLTIDLKNDHFNFTVLLKTGDFKEEYNLSQLNIPTLTPELVWVNKDYACMVTWWSQAQVRHIFIPTKQINEFIYLNKNVEETDSINNNIVYLDSIYKDIDKVVFKVENLLTRKTKSIEVSINEKNQEYPFYDKITLTKKELTIKTATDTKSIDIGEINNDL